MDESPNTEVPISEIIGALSTRVLWAILREGLAVTSAYLLMGGLIWGVSSYFGITGSTDPLLQTVLYIVFLWGFIFFSTSRYSFHNIRVYIPKTNIFSSLFLALYISLFSIFIISLKQSVVQLFLFWFVLGLPAFVYQIMFCGYFIVMSKRFPSYRTENFAVSMPEILQDLELKPGGISGSD
jgi:hypothetical protein